MFSIENTSLFKALPCLTGFSKDLRAHNNELGFITQTTAERNKVYIFTRAKKVDFVNILMI